MGFAKATLIFLAMTMAATAAPLRREQEPRSEDTTKLRKPTKNELLALAKQLRAEETTGTDATTTTGQEQDLSTPDYKPPDLNSPVNLLTSLRTRINDLVPVLMASGVDDLGIDAYAYNATRIFFEGSEETLHHIPETLGVLAGLQACFENMTTGSHFGPVSTAGRTGRDMGATRGEETNENGSTRQPAYAKKIYSLMELTHNIGERLTENILQKVILGAASTTNEKTRGLIDDLVFNFSQVKKQPFVYGLSEAMGMFENIGYKAADQLVFSVGVFEANIKVALNGQTTGHAFSIAYKGSLYQNGEAQGLARTAADAPQTNQSPSKRMHLASVSKPITTIVILRVLQDLGLSPEEEVAPFLPSDWSLGAGVADLTFIDFLTHRTGFSQISATNNYAGLRTAIATDVVDSSYEYSNANFGLMRVAIVGLLGYDAAQWGILAPQITEAAFLFQSRSLYSTINPAMSNIDCTDTSEDETIQYNFPDNGNSQGYEEPSRRSVCGGIGWHLSTNELAEIFTYLRNTELLLNKDMRNQMQDNFLGLMDPIDWGWPGGSLGVNYVHGGDWFHGAGELHSCIIAFPIQVEVGLVINSERGNIGGYQCVVLESAFENAWIVP